MGHFLFARNQYNFSTGTDRWIIVKRTDKTVTIRSAPAKNDPGARFAGKQFTFTWDGFGFVRSGRYLGADGNVNHEVDKIKAEIEQIRTVLVSNGADPYEAEELRANGKLAADVALELTELASEAMGREILTMEAMLRSHGYDLNEAKRLRAEGMGPEELAGVLARPCGEEGSLEWIHGMQRKVTS